MDHTLTLKKNHEFRRLYHRGRSVVSPYFALYCRQNGRPVNRFGITTGVKLGNAVKRNRARRRIRALYAAHEREMKVGFDLVVVARRRAIDGNYRDLERSFLQLIRKLGMGEFV